MYYVQDAHGFWNWIYFVILIVVSSWYNYSAKWKLREEFSIHSLFPVSFTLATYEKRFSEEDDWLINKLPASYILEIK